MALEKYYGNLFVHSGPSNNYFHISAQKIRVVKFYYCNEE